MAPAAHPSAPPHWGLGTSPRKSGNCQWALSYHPTGATNVTHDTRSNLLYGRRQEKANLPRDNDIKRPVGGRWEPLTQHSSLAQASPLDPT